jgi:hypothetical protein
MKKEASANECTLCHLIFILPQTLAKHVKLLHPEIEKDESTEKFDSEPKNGLKLEKKQRNSKKRRHLATKSMQDFKNAILLEHKQNLQKNELVLKNNLPNSCNVSENNSTVPEFCTSKKPNLEIVKREFINDDFQSNVSKPLQCNDDARIVGIVSSTKSYNLNSVIKTEPEEIYDVNTKDNRLKSIIKTELEEMCDVNAEDNQIKSIIETESEEMCDVNLKDNRLKSTIKAESEEMCDVNTEDNRLKSIITTEPEEMCDVSTEDNQLKSIIKNESVEICDVNLKDKQLESIIKTESEEMCDVNSEDNRLKSIIKNESEEMCTVNTEDKVEYTSIENSSREKGSNFYESTEDNGANEASPLILKVLENSEVFNQSLSNQNIEVGPQCAIDQGNLLRGIEIWSKGLKSQLDSSFAYIIFLYKNFVVLYKKDFFPYTVVESINAW